MQLITLISLLIPLSTACVHYKTFQTPSGTITGTLFDNNLEICVLNTHIRASSPASQIANSTLLEQESTETEQGKIPQSWFWDCPRRTSVETIMWGRDQLVHYNYPGSSFEFVALCRVEGRKGTSCKADVYGC